MTDTTFALVGIGAALVAGQIDHALTRVLFLLAACAFLAVALATTEGWI